MNTVRIIELDVNDTTVSEQIRHTLSICGGAMTVKWLGLSDWARYGENAGSEPAIHDSFVLISSELRVFYDEDERLALIAHEEGHIVLGHLDRIETGLLASEDFEMEADAYAARKVSKAAILRTLNKMMPIYSEHMLSKAAAFVGFPVEAIKEIVATALPAHERRIAKAAAL